MFEARKRVFVDLLKWDVPVLAGRYEIDQFDNPDAMYIVLADLEARHRASARLLHTDREHILGDLFPQLCDGEIPCGPTVREITRFCLEPTLTAADRRVARNQLVTALAEHAVRSGITQYTGVATPMWFVQVRDFGWRCEALGPARKVDGRSLVALTIHIDDATIAGLARSGIYTSATGGLAGGGLQ